MGKYSLLVIGGFMAVYAKMAVNLNELNTQFSDNINEQYRKSAARAAATSMANLSLAALEDSNAWRSGYNSISLGANQGGANIVDSSTDTSLTPAFVRVFGTGASGSVTDTVQVLAVVPFQPGNVRGAVTANSDVKTLGSIIVDGRDHDLSCGFIPGTGTYGVSTTQDFVHGGGSKVGGTTISYADKAPDKKPEDPSILEEYASYDFPAGPDSVLGYPPGTLKSMAQNGVNGGQYVTNPASLSYPFNGVTYVEMASDGVWSDIDFGTSRGILVVHNDMTNSKIKNLNSGTFQGVIIADDIEHIHCNIVGAVVSLTTTPKGNCIGNGNGGICYSQEAIGIATSESVGGDGGVTVMSWWE